MKDEIADAHDALLGGKQRQELACHVNFDAGVLRCFFERRSLPAGGLEDGFQGFFCGHICVRQRRPVRRQSQRFAFGGDASFFSQSRDDGAKNFGPQIREDALAHFFAADAER